MKNKSNLFAPLTSRAGIAATVLVAVSVSSALAADATWNVNTDGAWVSDSSWTPAAAPGSTSGTTSTDTATFGNIINAARVVTVDANRNIFGINFAGNSSAYTLSTGNLLLTSGGTLQTSGGGSTHTDVVGAPVTLLGDYTFATNSTTVGRILSIGTTVTSAATSGTTTLTLEGTGTSANNAITGVISNGTGTNKVAIVKNGATGNWLLSGANTFTGDVTLNAGTLRGTNTLATDVLNAFGTGAINLSGGTLQLRANGSGSNKTIVAGNNVTVGSSAATVDVNQSSGNSGSNFTFGNLSLGTGQLNVTGANTYSLRFSGTTDLTANATVNPTTANLSLIGAISGSGFNLTKTGASTGPASGGMTLSGANTYTGVTSVLEGRLTLNGNAPSGAAGTLGNATSAVLLGNSTGAVNAFLFANDYTIARDITVQSGNTGNATLGSIATSTNTTAYSGAITLGSAGGTGHNLTLTAAANHSVNITGTLQDPSGLAVGTAGIVTVSDATFANGLIDNSNNNTNGSSTMIFSGANTYSGGTVINFSGSTRINNDNAFGTGNLSIVKATITQGTSATALAGISGISLDGNLTLNSFNFGAVKPVNLGTVPITLTANRAISVVNGTSTVGGVISGTGRSLQVSGGSTAAGLTLNGANIFDGGLIVAGPASVALTVTSGNASGLGAGQATLTNSANSIVALAADTAVGSLTSGINHTATFTGGTSALTAGTYPLTITGGGGSGAAGTATVNSSGVVTAVSITNVGSNYTSSPTITLDSSTATITPAVFGSSSVATSSRTLTLAGTNASPVTYAGAITGNGGSLVKNGAGTQILTGASTYTGTTNINGGSLVVNGSLGATALAVNTTGTLSGTGSIGGFVTVANGGHLAVAIAATPGAQVPLQVAGAVTLDSGNILDLTATPTPANGVYTLITSPGGVTYTPGAVNLTGVSGAVSVSGDGLSLILTVSSGAANYASWATANGISGQPASGDFDKDGLTNLVEYALGKNPTVSSQPPGTLSGNLLTFTKGGDAIANGDVNFVIEESPNLVSWSPVVTQNAPNASTTISHTLPSGQSKVFARLKVVQIP